MNGESIKMSEVDKCSTVVVDGKLSSDITESSIPTWRICEWWK